MYLVWLDLSKCSTRYLLVIIKFSNYLILYLLSNVTFLILFYIFSLLFFLAKTPVKMLHLKESCSWQKKRKKNCLDNFSLQFRTFLTLNLNIFYFSIKSNWIGHKFHNLETSSPIHTWINTKYHILSLVWKLWQRLIG